MSTGWVWTVGVDEAGYGPNLGPLLQAAVAVRLPRDELAGWRTLGGSIRKAGGRENRDARLIVDDSKKVYHGIHALEKLELGAFAAFGLVPGLFREWLQPIALEMGFADLEKEFWYDGGLSLPVAAKPETLRFASARFRSTLPEGVQFALPRVRITPTPRFNEVVELTGSKATLLSEGLIELLREMVTSLPVGEHLLFLCDKQGGRNYYGEQLKLAFPNADVFPDLETAGESRYRIEGLDRVIEVVFRPRSDGESIAVALASMVCKYLREVCMMQFNSFWQKRIPNLLPTAGYPVDAKRFLNEIRDAMGRIGIGEAELWRCK